MTVRVAIVALLALAAQCGAAEAIPFARADINKDGVVEYWEAARIMPGLQPVQFRKCDPDRDGVIDRGEYPLLDNFYQLMFEQR